MPLRELAADLYRRDQVLAITGWALLAMLTAIVFVAPFDDRSILGLNPWIKPSKFLISVVIYVWTVAWVLDYIGEARTARRAISIGVATVMVVEIACIVLQSARGVRSHFNAATAFDLTVFALMAFGIFVNTALLALLGWLLFTRHRDLPRPYLWAVRLGILLILLGSAGGFVMIGSGGHVIGAMDGGPGLPFVNWSTVAGDLRIAHGVGLHGFQLLPLFAFVLGRARPQWSESVQFGVVVGFAAIYASVGVLALIQALGGRPLVAV